MGKKKENGAPREPKQGKQEDPTLLDDIKKYAAELGFPSAGGQESDFGDFAPSKAKKKVKDVSSSGDAGGNNNTQQERKKDSKQRQWDEKKKKKKENAKTVVQEKKEPLSFLPSIPKDTGNMKSVFSLKDEGAWYELMPDIPRDSPDDTYDDAYLSKLRARAARLLEVESIVAAKQDALSKTSSLSWLQQAKQGGTTSDKVAAMAVLVQEFPIAHLASLDGLVSMAGKRGGARAVVGVALDALLELWKDVLLPSDRKLKYFIQQPLSKLPSGKAADKCLILWEFEDRLKAKYATFVEQLAVLSTDNLDFIKEKATKIAFELLLNVPEQEGQLLRIVVNKLGDPDRKIASNAGYLITKLLAHHDGMKHVVVREIENFIYRPGLQDRARYYAVVYLNQIVLSNRDKPMSLPNKKSISLGKRLVDIYFTLFKLIIDGVLGTSASIAQAKQEKKEKRQQEKALKRGKKKPSAKEQEKSATGDRKGAMDSRMLSALITGIRRAFPYVSAEEVEPLIDAHADALFKLIHTGSFGVATQALLLLYQLMSSQSSISDRFYRAMYSVLLSRELPTSTKAPLFLSLFLKAIKNDVSNKRVIAFLKRLLQISLVAPANFACGCLIVVSQICKDSPGLWNTISDPEEILDDAIPAEEQDKDQLYDPSKRDPKYANAEKSCLWELVPLSKHGHPSVAAMAKTLLAGVPIQYNGDPLKDFVLAEFLDKFISKKSKPRTTTGGDSMMQPTTGRQSTHTPVLDAFESKQVAPDEAFFHQFFKISQERGKTVKRKAKHQDIHSDDDSSLAEDDFLAGEEGDDAAYGDVDDTFDYSQLADAMQEDRGTLSQPDKSDDDDSMSSLEGEEFPSESDEDDIDGPVHEEDENDDDNVFASLEDYSDMIAKDMNT